MSEKPNRLRKGTADDWPSLALLEFTVALARMMKANGDMKQKELAEKLGVSPPYISSVMAGNENLTVEQMSRLAEAAGGSLHLTIAPKGVYIRWAEDTLEEPTAAISPSPYSHKTPLNMPMESPMKAPRLAARNSQGVIQGPWPKAGNSKPLSPPPSNGPVLSQKAHS
ncbi:MAG TPA: helix-turn-helix transcriptional regulator [Thermoanaerobaculia bacterium]|nr:helix-turn-helix transcriptional regulator [Thermoanaerobaculia bacterium]